MRFSDLKRNSSEEFRAKPELDNVSFEQIPVGHKQNA